MKKRVLAGLSGGVDSSVAAALLVEQGFDVVGVTLKLYDYSDLDFAPPDGGCCSIDLINDARSVCASLRIPHYVVDLTAQFEKDVIDDFIDSYARGHTPNPCINCNRFMKWGEMLTMADKLSCDLIATGHYARVEFSDDAVRLLKGIDTGKDQSYALWAIDVWALSRTLLPLGGLTKKEVRQIASGKGFRNANRAESQEICFVPEGRYSALMIKRRGLSDPSLRRGPILDAAGRKIGEHAGYANYTIGQRKGLGISAPQPLYVTGIDPNSNSITVGASEQLNSEAFSVVDVRLLVDRESFPEVVDVKIRYRHAGSRARVSFEGSGGIVRFERPERAVTPGQSAVFYMNDQVLGGAIIDRLLES
jgi:tRNA-specific 2-thiouridylase